MCSCILRMRPLSDGALIGAPPHAELTYSTVPFDISSVPATPNAPLVCPSCSVADIHHDLDGAYCGSAPSRKWRRDPLFRSQDVLPRCRIGIAFNLPLIKGAQLAHFSYGLPCRGWRTRGESRTGEEDIHSISEPRTTTWQTRLLGRRFGKAPSKPERHVTQPARLRPREARSRL